MAKLDEAFAKDDAESVAALATEDEIKKLILAEELLEKRHERKQRARTWSSFAQALVGYVALAGFFANAYQSYANKKEVAAQKASEDERWAKEYKRAQDADLYRAFFETSALVTDMQNQSKRLVGYALLKQFVDDKDYNPKATIMLEESLAQELRTDTSESGLDDAHRASIEAILSALAESSDCKSLERAARSVDKLAQNRIRTGDLEESQEVYSDYVRKIFGRAVKICPTFKELNLIRAPLRDTLMRLPGLGELKGHVTAAQANQRIAEMLRDACQDEVQTSGISDCPEIWAHYKVLCNAPEKDNLGECSVVTAVSFDAPQAASAPNP